MLAALLDYPQATFVSVLKIDDGKIIATREVDAGLETISMPLPAVITTDLRLNEPRYPTLPNIMKAKQKPITQINLQDLNLQLKPHVEIISVAPPAQRGRGVMVASIGDLMSKLKKEAQVLPWMY